MDGKYSFPLPEMRVEVIGPMALHNHPCPVCRKQYSVLDLSCGVMTPCWECQKDGWVTLKLERGSLLRKFVMWVLKDPWEVNRGR